MSHPVPGQILKSVSLRGPGPIKLHSMKPQWPGDSQKQAEPRGRCLLFSWLTGTQSSAGKKQTGMEWMMVQHSKGLPACVSLSVCHQTKKVLRVIWCQTFLWGMAGSHESLAGLKLPMCWDYGHHHVGLCAVVRPEHGTCSLNAGHHLTKWATSSTLIPL